MLKKAVMISPTSLLQRLEIPEDCSKEEMRAGAEEVYIVVEGFSKRGG
jgi:hypothetical protein